MLWIGARRWTFNIMPMYSGTCNEGPFHGRMIHHPETRCLCFKKDRRIITYSWDEKSPLPAGVEVGAYLFYDGSWEWTRDLDERAPAV